MSSTSRLSLTCHLRRHCALCISSPVAPQQHAELLTEARDSFRRLATDFDPEATESTVKLVWQRLSVIRMQVSPRNRPRVPDSLKDIFSAVQRGEAGTFMIKDGQVISGEAAILERSRRYNDSLQDSDVRRHIALNERFHFRNRTM